MIRHIGIPITHLSKAIELYTEVLGFSVFGVEEMGEEFTNQLLGGVYIEHINLRCIKLTNPETQCLIELYSFENVTLLNHTNNCFHHISLTVPNIDSLYDTWLEKGLTIVIPPYISKDYSHKIFFGRDYDRNLLEFVEVLNNK